jgi:hypothetical protein
MSGNALGGMGRYYGLAASTTELVDNSTYDALIIHKQREIIRVVAEGNENSELVRQRQTELDALVNDKKDQSGRSAASHSRSIKLKEFRRFLLSQYDFA